VEYLKSSAHLQALLIEEGIKDSEQASGSTCYMSSPEEKANEAYRIYLSGKGPDGVADQFRKFIHTLQKAQDDRREAIITIQKRMDAYERVILRLCPPPPPPTPEEELQRIKLRMCELIDSECSGDEIKAELEKLTEVVF
jgi:hypothetical protein